MYKYVDFLQLSSDDVLPGPLLACSELSVMEHQGQAPIKLCLCFHYISLSQYGNIHVILQTIIGVSWQLHEDQLIV